MFAVIKTGGKQYKVAKDDVLTVEKLAAEAGETVQFNDVLMVGGEGDVSVGAPFVAGAGVQAEVVEQGKGPKTISFKRRRRKHSSARKKGHRQHLTTLKVLDILASGADASGVKAAIGAASAAAIGAAAPEKAEKPAKKAKKESVEAEVAAPAQDAPVEVAAEAPAEAPAEEPKVEAAAEAPASDAPEVEAEKPGNLLTEPKGDKDDLKKISGVGPKLEGLLNENGVYHFWQIAEWGPAEIAFMDDLLSFKGRIERDNWIAQAKDFAGSGD
jgi:large subunit ribosomal protein L21